MIKMWEAFKSLEQSDLQIGDKVIVKFKDSEHYMKTGRIMSIVKNGARRGDCILTIDFNDQVTYLYYTHLSKIHEIVEIPSGEVFDVLDIDAKQLAWSGVINYDKEKKIYFFSEDDKWEIEPYII